jgi:asparagine synthase (glutamine-hydrolysing)
MCGIAGVLSLRGKTPALDEVTRMTRVIAHRGPDGEEFHRSGPVALGHRRLAIIDLSPAGSQPMTNEDGTLWITYNGEIYNFESIRRELEERGHRFRSATDTEVVLHAYEEWGVECLRRFNGMFAFGLWDERRQRLWLVRDRIGIKPLFYARLADRFLFGSELKAVAAHPEFDRRLDLEALSYYLALNYTPAPYTLFAQARQLLPGHYLLVDAAGNVETKEYWDLSYDESRHPGEARCLAELDEQLHEAVRLRLVSDVPFGAFLSGGVDSSSVAYWMAREMDVPLKTFSIGFGEPSYDEVEYAREVAQRLETEHYERIVTADAATILPKVVWHAEEPTADSSMLAVYYLAQMAREHVTMTLSGDGADDILAGYETYQAYYLHRLLRAVPTWLRRGVLTPLVSVLPVSDSKVSWDFKLRRFIAGADYSPEDAHAVWRMIFDADQRERLLSPNAGAKGNDADAIALYRGYFGKTNARDPLNRMLYVDTRFYLPNDMLVKIDRMTMAHGLETRVPFLDHHLVEFVATLPSSLKLRRYLQKKYLLKKTMRSRLPERVLRRKKQGFNVPKVRWIKGELKSFVRDHLSPLKVRNTGLLDERVVTALLDDHFEERADNSHQIWCLLTLVIWLEQFTTGSLLLHPDASYSYVS